MVNKDIKRAESNSQTVARYWNMIIVKWSIDCCRLSHCIYWTLYCDLWAYISGWYWPFAFISK